MSASRPHRSAQRGLVLLAAALGLSIVALALAQIWSLYLANAPLSPAATSSIRSFWIPVSMTGVQGAAGLLGLLGFLMLWRGRWEVGSEFASRSGLAMLAVLIAGTAYALFAATGILLGFVPGAGFLVPWHGLLGVVGGVFLGAGLFGIFASLPIAGSRPVAAVALALGLAGIVLLNLAALGLRRIRTGTLTGAGLGLALASLVLWLVLGLWSEESLRSRRSVSAAPAPSGIRP